jgi:hypothetical protein
MREISWRAEAWPATQPLTLTVNGFAALQHAPDIRRNRRWIKENLCGAQKFLFPVQGTASR